MSCWRIRRAPSCAPFAKTSSQAKLRAGVTNESELGDGMRVPRFQPYLADRGMRGVAPCWRHRIQPRGCCAGQEWHRGAEPDSRAVERRECGTMRDGMDADRRRRVRPVLQTRTRRRPARQVDCDGPPEQNWLRPLEPADLSFPRGTEMVRVPRRSFALSDRKNAWERAP